MHARAHVHVHVHAHASSLNGVRFQGVPLASLNFNQISLSHWLRATLSLQPIHRLHYLSRGQMGKLPYYSQPVVLAVQREMGTSHSRALIV